MSASRQADLRAALGEPDREVRGDRGLADSALAGGDGDDVPDALGRGGLRLASGRGLGEAWLESG